MDGILLEEGRQESEVGGSTDVVRELTQEVAEILEDEADATKPKKGPKRRDNTSLPIKEEKSRTPLERYTPSES